MFALNRTWRLNCREFLNDLKRVILFSKNNLKLALAEGLLSNTKILGDRLISYKIKS